MEVNKNDQVKRSMLLTTGKRSYRRKREFQAEGQKEIS